MGVCNNEPRLRKLRINNKTNNSIDSSKMSSTLNDSIQSSSLNKTSNEINNELNKKVKADADKAIEEHNKIREAYKLKPLILKNSLCKLAQRYADKCAETESLDHCPLLYQGNIIGENIKEIDNEEIDISKICEEWNKEKISFDPESKKFNSKASHISQIIWKETEYVGFGWSTSPNKKSYFVAFYYPAGNIFF